MHVHNPIFQGERIKKIKPITLIVWVLGRVEKNSKKMSVGLVKRKLWALFYFIFTQT